MQVKIEGHCSRHGLDYNTIREKISKDINYASFFGISPKRQNAAENAFKDYLLQLEDEGVLKEVRCLTGKKGNEGEMRFINNGELVENKPNTTDTINSIDFKVVPVLNYMVSTDDIIIYISHKFIDEAGGTQNNAHNNLKTFCQHAAKNKDKDVYFIAVSDGEYHKKYIKKLKELREFEKRSGRLVIASVDNFRDKIREIVSE